MTRNAAVPSSLVCFLPFLYPFRTFIPFLFPHSVRPTTFIRCCPCILSTAVVCHNDVVVDSIQRHVFVLLSGESEGSSGGLTYSTVPVCVATVQSLGKLSDDGLMLAEVRTEDRSLSVTEGACYTVCCDVTSTAEVSACSWKHVGSVRGTEGGGGDLCRCDGGRRPSV